MLFQISPLLALQSESFFSLVSPTGKIHFRYPNFNERDNNSPAILLFTQVLEYTAPEDLKQDKRVSRSILKNRKRICATKTLQHRK